jgi:hypothetical protein
MIDFKDEASCIFGLRKSGKSTLADYIATQYGKDCLVYDTQHEFPTNAKYNTYRPKKRDSIDELFTVIHYFTIKRIPKTPKPEIIIIDEANRFFPGGGHTLDSRAVDLNDSLRHPPYEIGIIYISRRPVQLHPDIIGLADHVICFQLSGVRDINYLNDLKSGMGDEVQKLKKYWALMLSGNELKYIQPITPSKNWLSNQK